MKPTKSIWKNGKLIPWESATTHVLTHALHYATAVFEGIRAYDTTNGPAIFRAKEHYDRLQASATAYNMTLPYSSEELVEANKALIRDNELKACYIRPLVYYGYGEMGMNPQQTNPIDVIIAAWEWGSYLGEEGLKNGIRCKIPSIIKFDSRAFPATAKCSANYANSIRAKFEIKSQGYDEAILLNANGTVAEGPGENIFLIKDQKIYTPPITDEALEGITATSIIEIAKDLGHKIERKTIHPEELFTADELFFTGTAAEVTPIREVNDQKIGSGTRGPITEKLQSTFFDIVTGKNPNYTHWLSKP